MLHSLRLIVSAVGFAAVAGGIAYTAFAALRVASFQRRTADETEGARPPVTILKPVAGFEAELYENLRSFCDQSYPAYQLIFGVRDSDDAALPVIRRVMREFPSRDIALVIGDGSETASNPKVANLSSMYPKAKHDLLVVADADMRVDSSYLRAIAAAFTGENVGAVTSLYCGVPCNGFPSLLGAMYLNEQFAPSVLVARSIEETTYCFGATMAVRRDVLRQIGGFDSLAGHIGDDYMLGKLVTEQHYVIALASYIVLNVVYEPNLRSLWEHELRWARTVRSQRPRSYALMFFTIPLPIAALVAIIAGNLVAGLTLVACAAAVRVGLHYAVRRAWNLHDAARPWLIPIRDFFTLATWLAGFFGRNVRWRGRRFAIRGPQ
jgi:ceramide glucosyltransferase